MKKIFLVFALLALAAFFASAESAGNAALFAASPARAMVSESDTMVAESLVPAGNGTAVASQKAVSRLHLTASGIAVSEGNAFDVMQARVVVGSVKVDKSMAITAAEEEAAVGTEFIVRRIGVLKLDNSTYHLKDVAVSGEEVSAEIYGPATAANAASESVGEISLKLFEKPGQDVWAGNMVLDGKAYNVYFLGIQREFRLSEITEKIGDYCQQNTEDPKCLGVMADCNSDPVQCRERAREYCLNNPGNRGCLQLQKQYCLSNASDERCRAYLKGLCGEYPKLAHCRIRVVDGQRIIGIDANAVSTITAEAGEAETTLVSVKARPGLGNVKASISAVKNQNGNSRGN
jgi:hypothetical protein